MSFFSIIIPVYNKEHFIENTLKSVLNQTFSDFEVILVNDGSTDSSQQKILQFKDSRIKYYSQKNAGVSSARNYGIEKALSDYITFIDADDYWYPTFLEEMFKNINSFPRYKVFTAAIEIESSRKVFTASYSIIKTGNCQPVNYFNASLKESVICTSCAVFHKSVFEKIGTFDLSIKSGQDTDLWIRIGMVYPILFSWAILARYVYDSNSLSKNKTLTNKKLNFLKFSDLEKKDAQLKKFLDLNRFSLAIKSKIMNDTESFIYYYNAIDLKNISLKKRILLNQPSFVLKKLISIKEILVNLGLGNSVFK